jgi:hypothetical protein
VGWGDGVERVDAMGGCDRCWGRREASVAGTGLGMDGWMAAAAMRGRRAGLKRRAYRVCVKLVRVRERSGGGGGGDQLACQGGRASVRKMAGGAGSRSEGWLASTYSRLAWR